MARVLKSRIYFWRTFRREREYLARQLFPTGRIHVLSGPFAGMNYLNETVWGPLGPKWLGSYECELHEVIGAIVSTNYQHIIDVGCAEGYYAVGLAWRMPDARVFAYDSDFISRAQARKLARLNNVAARVSVAGFCTHAELGRVAADRTVLICDIEGAERELLCPSRAPSLKLVDVLVEVHEPASENVVYADLRRRFSSTHDIQEIKASTRQGWIAANAAHPRFEASRDTLWSAVDECRSNGLTWLWMTRHGRHS